MPKTIIPQITFMCPTGLGNPNASCRFHRASDNLPPDNMCPTCKKVLVKSTDPQDKITKTVIGEEDIETEIIDRDETKHRVARLAEIDDLISRMDAEGEFATPVKKEFERTRRQNVIDTEIMRPKKEGYFLATLAEIDAYRAKRKQDIEKAIIEARKLEDK